jgi:hypothetical protein
MPAAWLIVPPIDLPCAAPPYRAATPATHNSQPRHSPQCCVPAIMPRVCCCCALSLAVLCSACLPPSLANDVQADNNQARSAAFYALPNAPAAERNSASSSSSSSAAAAAIPLWPAGRVPSERADSVGAEYETCLTKGVAVADCQDLSVHNVTVPTISPYLVDGADSAVVIAPGGGYGILAINREGTDIAAWLNSIGVSAFVLKYRVPGRSWLPFGAAPLMDAQRAMGLVREMASSGKIKGLNESKVGFMGFSAGGHLTGHLNVAWASRSYAHIDAADAKPCRPNFSMMIYVRPHSHALLCMHMTIHAGLTLRVRRSRGSP